MNRHSAAAVSLAALVLLSNGAVVAGVAAGGPDQRGGSAASPAATAPPVVLQNVTVGELELANVTLESVVIERLVVRSSRVEEGDEVPGLNETNATDGQPTVFRSVAFDQLTLRSVSLHDLEQSSAGPVLNRTRAGDGNATANETGVLEENVTIRNVTVQEMVVGDFRVSNLTVVNDEDEQDILTALSDFVSGILDGDGGDGQANETNATAGTNETNATNETAGPIEEALGPQGDEGEVIDTLVIERLHAEQVAVDRMVVQTFRSGGTEAIEETPNATTETTTPAENETGLLGDGNETGNETGVLDGENETGDAEHEVAVLESVSVGRVAIQNVTADIWVVGEVAQQNVTAAGVANETAAVPAGNGTNESDGV